MSAFRIIEILWIHWNPEKQRKLKKKKKTEFVDNWKTFEVIKARHSLIAGEKGAEVEVYLQLQGERVHRFNAGSGGFSDIRPPEQEERVLRLSDLLESPRTRNRRR